MSEFYSLLSGLAMLERMDEADRELACAHSALARVPHEPSLEVAVTVHRWLVEVRAGRRDAQQAVSDAAELVQESPNDDSRFALRALTALVHGSGSSSPRHELLVWAEGSAFRPPDAEDVVRLPARSPLRRVFAHLVTRRLESPGEIVSIDDVIAAGWPGERIGADAALNRAYVALSSLRKKGLRDVLLSTAGGYALSQAVVVRRMPETPRDC